MLHTAESTWSREPADLSQFAMATTPVEVSMSAPVALQEASLKTPVAQTWTQQSTTGTTPEVASTGLDTAMMAMALVSAWMVLAGTALLVRHVRVTRIEATQL